MSKAAVRRLADKYCDAKGREPAPIAKEPPPEHLAIQIRPEQLMAEIRPETVLIAESVLSVLASVYGVTLSERDPSDP